MKRNILFIGYEPPLYDEIRDFIYSRNGLAYFSANVEQSLHALSIHPIDMVVLMMYKPEDAALLNYINRNYPEIEVLVSASKEYEEMISIFNEGHFSVLRHPLKLQELKEFI